MLFREMMILREVHGCSYREIGQIVGVPVATVRSRLSRVRQRLREKRRPHASHGDGEHFVGRPRNRQAAVLVAGELAAIGHHAFLLLLVRRNASPSPQRTGTLRAARQTTADGGRTLTIHGPGRRRETGGHHGHALAVPRPHPDCGPAR